ncbi:MAG: uroporphyrinogen decarboxylase family protein, partial [Fidelibacterota bacterium]
IWIHGSASSLTVISPQIYRDINLPFLKMITKACKEEGVPSHVHICGKSRLLVQINAEETHLDMMEVLEPPPGGDVDLKEVKQKFGNKLALKGNINTFETMFKGSPEDVERKAKWCIDAAAEGGGFILSTGDQCGRDTPTENLRRLVEVASTYGRY